LLVMNAATPTGSPTRPSSTARRAVCAALPRNVSGADPTSNPAASAIATRRCASASDVVMGFST
jgi:hypothetical protein